MTGIEDPLACGRNERHFFVILKLKSLQIFIISNGQTIFKDFFIESRLRELSPDLSDLKLVKADCTAKIRLFTMILVRF